MEPASLRRGVVARLRTVRFLELVAWIAPVVIVWDVLADTSNDRGVDLFVLGAAALIFRLAIATEWVRCDATGISWRSYLFTHRIPWDQVIMMGIAPRRFGRGRYSWASMCIEIDRPTGPPVRVTPSAWVPMMRQGEFIAAARLISPIDWSLLEPSEDASGNGGGTAGRFDRAIESTRRRRASGKRVGQPIARRRQGPGA